MMNRGGDADPRDGGAARSDGEAGTAVVVSRRSGKPASFLPTVATAARTLDISARFLVATLFAGDHIETADRLMYGWSRDIFRYANASLTAVGLENIRTDLPCLVMSNHSSLLDIPAMIATYPGSMRMVTKESLTRVPIWGHALKACGFIPIDRRHRERAIEQLEVAKRVVGNGVAVWIAPEGTRGQNASLGAFKKGGFHLARQLDAYIVPAYVDSATAVLPVGTLRARYDIEVTVHYGELIPPSDDMPSQMDRVREAILELSGGRLVNST